MRDTALFPVAACSPPELKEARWNRRRRRCKSVGGGGEDFIGEGEGYELEDVLYRSVCGFAGIFPARGSMYFSAY